MPMVAIWILLSLPVLVLSSCNNITGLVEIGSCEYVHGPPINCSGQVLDHVTVMKQLYENLTFHEKMINSGKIKFKRMKLMFKTAKKLLKEAVSFHDFLKEDQAQYQNISLEFCVNMIFLEQRLAEAQKYVSLFNSFKKWIDYYFPIVAGLEFAFGMLGNMMIVVIFINNEDMRTGPNRVILNLAVGDVFLLVTNTLMYYIRYRWLPIKVSPRLCRVMSYTRAVAIASSVYSMVVLSMLRFLAVASIPGSKPWRFRHKFPRIPVLLALTWLLAAVAGIPEAFDATILCEFGTNALTKYLRFACLCLLPLAGIAAFSVATSRILRRSGRRLPGEHIPNVLRQTRARKRGAKVVLCLVAVFCITYLPLNVYSLIKDEYDIINYHFRFFTQLLIPLNSCLNPAALCVGCSKFRKIFKSYFSSVIALNFDSGKSTVEAEVSSFNKKDKF